jgi:hypothetical protein
MTFSLEKVWPHFIPEHMTKKTSESSTSHYAFNVDRDTLGANVKVLIVAL